MVYVIVIILIAILGVTALMNRNYMKDKQEMLEGFSFVIKKEGREVALVKLEDIEKLNPIEFIESLKSSGQKAEVNKYKGVLLRDILAARGESLEGKSQVTIRSIDGYAVALSAEEVGEEDNVYIVYEANGEPLASKDEGGSGPYQIVIRNDPFGQRWAKFVVEVDLE